MVNELWEIVRVDQLKVGDVVLDLRGGVIESYEIDPELVEIAKGSPKSFYPPKLRRVDPADDPRVLRRAMRLMHFALYDERVHVPMAGDPQNYIDQARRELESEWRDESERTDDLQG